MIRLISYLTELLKNLILTIIRVKNNKINSVGSDKVTKYMFKLKYKTI